MAVSKSAAVLTATVPSPTMGVVTVLSNANTNVSMMGETFKYCAPIAGALGFSAEDTAEAILHGCRHLRRFPVAVCYGAAHLLDIRRGGIHQCEESRHGVFAHPIS